MSTSDYCFDRLVRVSAFLVAFFLNFCFLSNRLERVRAVAAHQLDKADFSEKKSRAINGGTVSLCTITNGEEYYVDEWTDYFLALGFTDILIYDRSTANDLRKRRDKMRVGDEKIEVVHWPGDDQEIHSYKDCVKRAIAKNRTWVAFLDVHEFLILRKHKDISSLLDEFDVVALSFSRYLFGDGDVSAEPLTRRFIMREATVDPIVKSIIRVTNPDLLKNQTFPHLHTGLQYDTNRKRLSSPCNPNGPVDIAVLHHYLTMSAAESPRLSREKWVGDSFACGTNGSERLFNVIDDSAWLELTKRVPHYSFFDKFYGEHNEDAPLRSLGGSANMNTASLCAIAIDEERYLDEWTDYYFALGFFDIIIYDNSLGNNLHKRRREVRIGDERIEIIHWPGDAKQVAAYTDCATRCRARNRTWAAFFDIDEFLVLRKHENVVSLLEEHCQAGAVSFNWYVFGTSGFSAYSSEPVTRRFNKRAYHVIDGVKSVVKLSDWKGFENPHYPILSRGSQHDTNNHSFVGPSNENGTADVASLYHLWSKSAKEFYWKACVRGRAGETINSLFHKYSCGKDLNVTLFPEFDNAAWLELRRRVSLYSMFDKFYNNSNVKY